MKNHKIPQKFPIITTVIVSILSLSPSVEATTVYLDFGASSGTEGGNWNTISAAEANGGEITGLVDWNTGAAVPWTLDAVGSWVDTVYTGWDTSTAGNWAGAATGNDALLVSTGQILGKNLRFLNVDPNETFTVEIISYVSGGSYFKLVPSDIIVIGDLGNSAADGDAKNLGLDGTDYDPSDPIANGEWLIYNDTKAGGGAGPGDPGEFTINFDFSALGSKDIIINAVRITSVPEPSSSLLFLLGGIATCVIRRRA